MIEKNKLFTKPTEAVFEYIAEIYDLHGKLVSKEKTHKVENLEDVERVFHASLCDVV